jgi:hypothetical protein
MSKNVKMRVEVTKAYYESGHSYKAVKIHLTSIYGARNCPTDAPIEKIIKKFQSDGTCHGLRRGKVGRPPLIVTEESIETGPQYFDQNPTSSTRQASRVPQILRGSPQRIMHKNLKLYPYKIQIGQDLTEYDMDRRLKFANLM